MPRRRPRSTDPDIRFRNMLEATGLPALAGLSRLGNQFGGQSSSLAQAVPADAPSLSQSAQSGELLVLSATADSIASGGDYVVFDTIVHQRGFSGTAVASNTVIWPTSAIGAVTVEFDWDTYTAGGTIEIEVDGSVPAWGVIASGSSGSSGFATRPVDIAAGSSVKVKVTQSSGSAKTADVFVAFSVFDPVDPSNGDYETVVLADGPLAYWRLGEASGTTATDSTGNGYTGTYAGTRTQGFTPVMQDGSGNLALDLSAASSSGVTGVDWGDMDFANVTPYSLECWFNADAITTFAILVQKQDGTSGDGWELSLGVTGGQYYVASTRGYSVGGNVSSDPGTVTLNTDHHVVSSFDGTTVRLYIDGQLVDSATSPANIATNTVPVSIGYDSGDTGGGFGFDGTIDEVTIYTRALGPSEVLEHYLVGSSG